jgi:hypothetical protein
MNDLFWGHFWAWLTFVIGLTCGGFAWAYTARWGSNAHRLSCGEKPEPVMAEVYAEQTRLRIQAIEHVLKQRANRATVNFDAPENMTSKIPF